MLKMIPYQSINGPMLLKLEPRATGLETRGLALLQVRAHSVCVTDADSIDGPLVAIPVELGESKEYTSEWQVPPVLIAVRSQYSIVI